MKKRKKRSLLPQTKALRYLAKTGWIADPAERKMGLISKDWGGFVDIIAIDPLDGEVLLIQVTSRTNVSSRVKKILALDTAQRLCGLPKIRILVWGYEPGDEVTEPHKNIEIFPNDFLAAGSAPDDQDAKAS